jgi:hypothetical protein
MSAWRARTVNLDTSGGAPYNPANMYAQGSAPRLNWMAGRAADTLTGPQVKRGALFARSEQEQMCVCAATNSERAEIGKRQRRLVGATVERASGGAMRIRPMGSLIRLT